MAALEVVCDDDVVPPPRLKKFDVGAEAEVVVADAVVVGAGDAEDLSFPLDKVGNKDFGAAVVPGSVVLADVFAAPPRLGNVNPDGLDCSLAWRAGAAGLAKKLFEVDDELVVLENNDEVACEDVFVGVNMLDEDCCGAEVVVATVLGEKKDVGASAPESAGLSSFFAEGKLKVAAELGWALVSAGFWVLKRVVLLALLAFGLGAPKMLAVALD